MSGHSRVRVMWTLMQTFASLQKWIIRLADYEASPEMILDFANSIGVWRNFSEPWDMAENGFKAD